MLNSVQRVPPNLDKACLVSGVIVRAKVPIWQIERGRFSFEMSQFSGDWYQRHSDLPVSRLVTSLKSKLISINKPDWQDSIKKEKRKKETNDIHSIRSNPARLLFQLTQNRPTWFSKFSIKVQIYSTILFLLCLKWKILISSELTVRLIPSPGNDDPDWSPSTREEIHIHWELEEREGEIPSIEKHKSRCGRTSGQPRSCERADAFLSRKWSIGPRKALSFTQSRRPIGRNELNLCQGRVAVDKKKWKTVWCAAGYREGVSSRFSFRSGTRATIFSNSATLTRPRPYSERFSSSRLPHRHVALVFAAAAY